MAKSKAKIELDYRKAEEQSKSLEKIAKELEQLANRQFSEVLRNVSAQWKGESAELYVKKGTAVCDELRDRAREIRKTAESVQKIARNVYNAEMEALKLAQQRTYQS
ncbi:MAG: hypothetical protein Q4F21_14425 [Lachnospiraceae bacterium]|nr:hypothetical protein [Lachnospiraceae bacterium]